MHTKQSTQLVKLLGTAFTAFGLVACNVGNAPSESPVQREIRNENLDLCDDAPVLGAPLSETEAEDLTQIPNVREDDTIILRAGDFGRQRVFPISEGMSLWDLAQEIDDTDDFEARVGRDYSGRPRLEFNTESGLAIDTDDQGNALYKPALYEIEYPEDEYVTREILGNPYFYACEFSYTQRHIPRR